MECCGALDLASKLDLTAWALVFRRDNKYYVRSHFWMPMATVQKKKTSRLQAELLSWANDGHITLTDGDTTDYTFVIAHVAEESNKFQLLDVAFDPWNATTTAEALSRDHGIEMVEYGQRYATFNEPAKELEKLIVSGDIIHDGNPVMTWCVSNCRAATDPSGNIRPVKPQHGEENKVDGVVTMTMALGRGMQRLQNDNATLAFI
jgi:phage terminase large subunit-like protein